jgi:putative heme iron utilization protein
MFWMHLVNDIFSQKIALPSGKHTKNYGKLPFLMGKSTINGHFE